MTTNQSTDNNNITLRQLISLFRVEALTKPEVTSRSYLMWRKVSKLFANGMYVVVIIIHQNIDVASWLYNSVSHAVLYQGGSTDIKRPDALRIASGLLC